MTCIPVQGSIARPSPSRQHHQSIVNGSGSVWLKPQHQALVARQLPLRAERRPYLVVRSINGGVNGEARIKVIGVGGGGGNALNRMIQSELKGIEFWAVNTDVQALAHHSCSNRMQIGSEVTRGLGCGGNPQLGQAAALESEEALKQMVAGADLVFVTAGMGGGTGSGAAPVVAKCAKDAGILTVGVVTYPFSFEGRRRCSQAVKAIEALRESVDSVVIIPNDKLLEVSGEGTALTDAFSLADDVLRQGVQSISDIITVPGLINVDFADVRSIMANAGPDRAEQAALAAVSAPLIQQSVERATGIIFNITGGSDLTLNEVNRVSQVVTSLADPAANIIFGAVVDPSYEGELHVTIIATGFAQSFEEELFGQDKRKRGAGAAARAHQQVAGVGAQQAGSADSSVMDTDDTEAAGSKPSADGLSWNRQSKQIFGRGIF
eukprot:gene2452-2755_t